MLLTGHTGLLALGATFMALGCYFNINLLDASLPWIPPFRFLDSSLAYWEP